MSRRQDPLVRLERITKAYPGVVANDAVSLDLWAGEIHAVIGENGAGKSTLMGVLYGVHRPDSGRVLLDGEEIGMTSPRVALARGIGYVQQHYSLIPTLTVAENFVLAMRGGGRPIGRAEGERRIAELGSRYGLEVPGDVPVERLGVGVQQRAELLKALGHEARVLILDEPDALLTAREWEELAAVLRRLAADGIGIFLISHRLRAVLSVADRVSVLRRGRLVATTSATGADEAMLARQMVGELPAPSAGERQRPAPGGPVLEVRGLAVGSDRGGLALESASFVVHGGEILGIAGVEGNGQIELTEALAGARPALAGEVLLDGVPLGHAGVAERQRLGISHVPADRRGSGLVASLSVTENLLLSELDDERFRRWGLLQGAAMREHAERLIERFDIRVPGPDVAAGTLSGGNQQKVVLARELDRPLRVLICCYPTRGLDVASSRAIVEQMIALRDRGAAVVWAALELDDLLELADRIIVLHDGEITGEVAREEADAESLGAMMTISGGAR